MSFRCQNCDAVQKSGTKPVKTVTKIRPKVYPVRYSDPEKRHIIDNGGHGTEIAEELNLCEKCAKKVGTPVTVDQVVSERW